MFSMPIETLAQAFWAHWRVTARCAYGNREAMKSIRECQYKAELDMHTLLWTRGPDFPLSRLETRMMCPWCRSRDVRLIFHVPGEPQPSEDRVERHWAREQLKRGT